MRSILNKENIKEMELLNRSISLRLMLRVQQKLRIIYRIQRLQGWGKWHWEQLLLRRSHSTLLSLMMINRIVDCSPCRLKVRRGLGRNESLAFRPWRVTRGTPASQLGFREQWIRPTLIKIQICLIKIMIRPFYHQI